MNPFDEYNGAANDPIADLKAAIDHIRTSTWATKYSLPLGRYQARTLARAILRSWFQGRRDVWTQDARTWAGENFPDEARRAYRQECKRENRRKRAQRIKRGHR